METVKKTLEMPSDTLKALEQLAKITGADGGVPEVIQDALRVYEWAVYQQANGNAIVAAPITTGSFGGPVSLGFSLPQGGPKTDPTTEVLGQLFDDKAAEEAKRFFKAA